ncbi:MAG: zinc-ribbon domain-containing protein [Vicingaceae bacterium]
MILTFLLEKYPETLIQFDPVSNKGVQLNEVGVGSRISITWKCSKAKDHIWQASPNQRTSGGKLRGCPVCAGKKVVRSNSIGYSFPTICKEWDYKKNKRITPFIITSGSNKKVWWQCDSNHNWLASPKQRTAQNNSCPICNSLSYNYPEISNQFHPILNGNIIPESLDYSSHKRIWWKCPKGFDHVWQAAPNSRVFNKSGCPICSGHKVVKSNSLSSVFPELATQWFYEKNELSPDLVYSKSTKKIWWKCEKGEDHIWKSSVKSRANGIGCPICSGRKTVKSNSLANLFPEVSKQWHKERNKDISPFDVTPFSSKEVWWKCPKGEDHIWEATVANVVNGSTCPVCMGRKITTTNNFAVLHPDLLKEWDFNANYVDPKSLSPGTKDKMNWVCSKEKSHLWKASVSDRTKKGSGCPVCSIKLNVSETKMLELIKSLITVHDVLYRSKPKWLERMEFDVFIPDIKLAFEYQGQQHFRPIDFFGGKEVFEKQVKRDKRKKKLCFEHEVTLIEVYYDEELTQELIKNKIINSGVKVELNY